MKLNRRHHNHQFKLQSNLNDCNAHKKSNKQLKEEAQIRQEKLNLIRQEEILLVRQDEMLKQIQDEKAKLLKQEEMIRSRQQDRLKQVSRWMGK